MGVVLGAALAAMPPRVEAARDEVLLDEPSKSVAAPDFTAETLAGETVRLSAFKGQVVFLNFWATWCVPCKEEMPAMERVHLALQGRRFRLLAVNLQEAPAAMQKFVEELGLTFDIVLDPSGEITRDYNVINLPITYLIDKQGTIVARAIGQRPWDNETYLRYLRNLVASEK